MLDALIPEHGGNWLNIESIRGRVQVNISDMRDLHSLNELVKGKGFIFNLAGQVSHGDSMRDPHLDLPANCISSMNLVESCRKYKPTARLIYTSTRQVYGVPMFLPETRHTRQCDVNGINQLAADYYYLRYHRVYGLQSTVLRLTNTYGPHQQIRNNRQGFVGIFIRQALQGERICVYGTG